MWHRGQSWKQLFVKRGQRSKTQMTHFCGSYYWQKELQRISGTTVFCIKRLFFCIKMNTALARGIWQIFYALGTSLLMAIITHNLSLKILNYPFKVRGTDQWLVHKLLDHRPYSHRGHVGFFALRNIAHRDVTGWQHCIDLMETWPRREYGL